MRTPVSLAVIVIARNEEKTISECLRSCVESVASATEAGLVGITDIVLVDSASTDHTREVASRFPVRVLAIPPHWPLSAAAGRFVGLRETKSNVVMFVDGDYVLEPTWLVLGLRELADPSVAGVCGVDREALPGTSAISRYVRELTESAAPRAERAETDSIAVGLVRRQWIERAGGVQPFLRGAEDRDLSLRIRILGGRILKTQAIMGTHHWAPGQDLDLVEYLRSVSRWSYGEGQAARYAAGDRRIRDIYVRRYANLRHLIQLEMGLLLLAWLATAMAIAVWGGVLPFLGSVLLGFLLLGVVSARQRAGFRNMLFRFHQVPYVVVRLFAFATGLFNRPRPSLEYPTGPVLGKC